MLATALWPLAASAQAPARVPVVGFLINGRLEPSFGYFKGSLKELGYEDGRNIRIESRVADGKPEMLPGLAGELVRLNADVLVAVQTPAVTALKNATTRIPIVMSSGDPVATGLVASLARPGGNITGVTSVVADVGGKILELIREILPRAKRVGVLANASDPFTRPFVEQLNRAAPALGVELAVAMVRETAEIAPAVAAMAGNRTDVVIVQPSLQRRVAAEHAAKNRLPAVSPSTLFPEEGGLASYAGSQREIFSVLADYVVRVLRGAKPADLPVQQTSRFELAVNLKTARALGLAIPNSVIVRADRLIE